ncbi:Na+/H+ antiporter NhaA [Nanchangia anserum]|uniref:Na(+)/H(+) antiporter NhaA n=1 Tax=Nanchangia anserum TaxID=2692125 RepID=A0A8I0GHA3_9ACTO|nr:Na+/H+ antiporter NhaA [Nanchangia anserum]MBD3689974.1 Na+/H+ antiporter NhaA [Nanchangia anserum]QOX82220.1 Na+/H+ antiporter NhaA [Nanchangia anserum]
MTDSRKQADNSQPDAKLARAQKDFAERYSRAYSGEKSRSGDLRSPFPDHYEDLNFPYSDSPTDYESTGLWGRIKGALANDIVAGLLLIVLAVLALIVANSPIREAYFALSHAEIGISAINLKMSVAHWAQDGVLVLFFFVVGLELKQEFVNGSLRDPRTAAMPIIAALFGMAGPALIYCLVTALTGDSAWHGWAIPTATDIAFAVAILQIFGRGMPLAARTFLLTLAVADDLGGIIVIALFYSSGEIAPLLINLALAIVAAVVFSLVVRRGIVAWWILLPIGVVCWYFMHASGIHATIAGVLLGMVVPASRVGNDHEPMTERLTEAVNPFSAGLAVPIFAFFAAGVDIIDSPGGPSAMLTNPVTLSVALALPIGKFLGIFGSVTFMYALTPLTLGKGVKLRDIMPISFVAGIGFTVALLLSHLAFTGDETRTQAGSLGVVLGTFLSTIIGAILLTLRVRRIRAEAETE